MNIINIDKIIFTIILEYIFKLVTYCIATNIAPIKLDINTLIFFIFTFVTIPVAYKII